MEAIMLIDLNCFSTVFSIVEMPKKIEAATIVSMLIETPVEEEDVNDKDVRDTVSDT
jgi:hypothetical protein